MIKYEEIREVHLELSTNCNASCPLCPRNIAGYPYNAGYPITELTLSDIKNIFPPRFIKQLYNIIINGNLGDFMLARDALEIVEYFREHSKHLIITINTNGSARNNEFWTRLAKSDPAVYFALDGLEDTHSLYRIDTSFRTIIKNASTYISAGGNAIWKMIKFDHNKHQIDECRSLAKSLGFKSFELMDHGRDSGSVFNKKGEYQYTLGTATLIETPVQVIENNKSGNQLKLHYNIKKADKIDCYSKKKKSIYISADGDVFPCCYLGFYPRTYDTSQHRGNDQIKAIIDNKVINAKEKPLQECLEWFNEIESSWIKESFDQGLIWQCNQSCGVN